MPHISVDLRHQIGFRGPLSLGSLSLTTIFDPGPSQSGHFVQGFLHYHRSITNSDSLDLRFQLCARPRELPQILPHEKPTPGSKHIREWRPQGLDPASAPS